MMEQESFERLAVQHPNGRYDVVVGAGLLPRLRELAGVRGQMVVVTDDNVGPHHAAQIEADAVITVPAGEVHKNLDFVRTIYDGLFAVGMDRKGTVVALGGGVIGDMAGFAAATYMRGVDFVQCPTTLLSMVDASVGGKVGVDVPQGKNLVGAFKQPTAVCADITTLQTLPAVEFAAGMAEVIKHGILNDGGILRSVERGEWGVGREDTPHSPHPTLYSLIAQAICVKRDVVEEDPYEQGRRAHLNLGHTFGHAIEQVSQFRVRHGEGVAMGLVAAARLSARLEHCDPVLQGQIEEWLTAVNLPTRIPADLDAEAIYAAMGTDKKKAGGRVRFVLLHGLGEPFTTGEVAETAVIATIRELQA
ncbi:MAG: 3-dehydroquinate synthase [Ardenticatenaceae bacterium]|nr:3-dehydroquinate synthase [Ardenticatenaceae bacterium]